MQTITDIALEKYGIIDYVGELQRINNVSVMQDLTDLQSDSDGKGIEPVKEFFKTYKPDNAKQDYYPISFYASDINNLTIKLKSNSGVTYRVDGVGTYIRYNNQYMSSFAFNTNTKVNVKFNFNDAYYIYAYALVLGVGTLNLKNVKYLEHLEVRSTNVETIEYDRFCNLSTLIISSCELAGFDFSGIKEFGYGIAIDFTSNSMTETEVDNTLISLDSYTGVYVGTIDISSNTAPSATGLAAKASLEAKGWTVTND